MTTLSEVIQEIEKDGRICPQPDKWHKLWEMLPNKKRKGAGWEPPLPLILAAWYDAPIILKKIRIQEHIKWAETHGMLEDVYNFLKSLKPEDWYYGE